MKKLTTIDTMKVLATILVVVGHITRMYTNVAAIKINTSSEVLSNLTSVIYSFHMPAFVAISGILYFYVKRQRLGYQVESKFIKGKIKRLIIPYIFFSFCITIPTLYFCNLIDKEVLKYIFENFILMKSPRHLWFLIMLFCVFVIFNKFESYIYKRVVIFIILSGLVNILNSYYYIPYFQITSTLHYFFYFLLGYYFQMKLSYKFEIMNIKELYTYLIYAIILFFIIYICTFKSPILHNILSLVTAICGTFSLYLFSNIISRTNIKSYSIYKVILSNSYGIYLFHPMIIYCLFYSFKDSYINPYIFSSIVFVVSMTLSITLTKVTKKINNNFI